MAQGGGQDTVLSWKGAQRLHEQTEGGPEHDDCLRVRTDLTHKMQGQQPAAAVAARAVGGDAAPAAPSRSTLVTWALGAACAALSLVANLCAIPILAYFGAKSHPNAVLLVWVAFLCAICFGGIKLLHLIATRVGQPNIGAAFVTLQILGTVSIVLLHTLPWWGSYTALVVMFVSVAKFDHGSIWHMEQLARLNAYLRAHAVVFSCLYSAGVLCSLPPLMEVVYMPKSTRLFLLSWHSEAVGGLLILVFVVMTCMHLLKMPLPVLLRGVMLLTCVLAVKDSLKPTEMCELHEYTDHMEERVVRHVLRLSQQLVGSRTAYDAHGSVARFEYSTTLGCIQGNLSVYDQLSSHLQVGSFVAGASLPAVLRFTSRADDVNQITTDSGAGLRLYTPDGSPHDFILSSRPTLFTSDPLTYIVSRLPQPLRLWLKHGFNRIASRHLLELVVHELRLVLPVRFGGYELRWTDPVATTFHSVAAFKLGEQARVRYILRPCGWNVAEDVAHQHRAPNSAEDVMKRLHHHSNARGVCMELGLQEQLDPCLHDVNDLTVEWDSPVTVVCFEVPRNVDTLTRAQIGVFRSMPQPILWADKQRACSNLQLHSWNAPASQSPVGFMSDVRRAAYEASAAHRPASEPGAAPTSFHEQQFNGPPILLSDLDVLPAGRPDLYEHEFYAPPFSALPKHLKHFDQLGSPALGLIRRFIQAQTTARDIHIEEDPATFGAPADYARAFQGPSLPPPSGAMDWDTDTTFAAVFIRGPGPIWITAASDTRPLPSELSIADNTTMARIEAVLAGQGTFQELFKAGRLFFVDYKLLVPIEPTRHRVFYAPIVVLYLHRSSDGVRQLRPLLVQLTRFKSAANVVYLPTDAPNLWQFVKMHVAQADAFYHELIAHLGFTHLAMEPIVISFYRQLNHTHPIMKMMEPHFSDALALNTFGRRTLIAKDGLVDKFFGVGLKGGLELMNAAFTTWSFSADAHFPRSMEARGFPRVLDVGSAEDNLPGYFYRDDGYEVWDAIRRYVHQVVDSLYKHDAEVANDVVLQALYTDMTSDVTGNVRGVLPLNGTHSLIEFLTTVIFTCTAQHSAVNYGQYDYYAFPPAHPVGLTRGIPPASDLLTRKYMASALPPLNEWRSSVKVARMLSLKPQQQVDEFTNVQLVTTLMGLEALRTAYPEQYSTLERELQEISDGIAARKVATGIDYWYMDPVWMLASVSV